MQDMKPVMMIKIEKGERTYRFEMPVGAPLGECYDVAFSILKHLVELSEKAVANAKPQEEAPAEVAAEVVDTANVQ